MKHTGIIILAAGSSSRLGQSKQLLPFKHTTLLRHVIAEAKKAVPEFMLVVTGANAVAISASIENEQVETIFNAHWAEGRSSAIVAGVHKIMGSDLDIQQIIITVCDQPFISASLFSSLYQVQQQSGKSMVASVYAGTMGTPVLLTKKHFDALLDLTGDEGAKKLLNRYPEDIALVDFPNGHIDIDTIEDYESLLSDYRTF